MLAGSAYSPCASSDARKPRRTFRSRPRSGASFWCWCAAAENWWRKVSEQLAAPLDVQDLQIVWEAPDGQRGQEGRAGDPVRSHARAAGSAGEDRRRCNRRNRRSIRRWRRRGSPQIRTTRSLDRSVQRREGEARGVEASHHEQDSGRGKRHRSRAWPKKSSRCSRRPR